MGVNAFRKLGHIEGIEFDGRAYRFTVYLYDEYEDYMAYVVEHGIYKFDNRLPRRWAECKLHRLLGEASIRRIVSAIEAGRAYA